MSDVQFDTDLTYSRNTQTGTPSSYGSPSYPPRNTSGTGGMSGWLMRKGLAKSAKAANIILGIVIVIALSITFYNLFGESSAPTTRPSAAGSDTLMYSSPYSQPYAQPPRQ